MKIKEFEELLNLRVHMVLLQDRGLVRESNRLTEFILKYTIAANKILNEYELFDLKAIFRGGKFFIIFKPTGRIACEIVADGVYKGEYVWHDKPLLLSRHGYTKAKTIEELIDYTARKGKTVYSGMKREEHL